MQIEVKGHSGCQIEVTAEDGTLYVHKSSSDPKYLDRLVNQALKQKNASTARLQHIRVPQIIDILRTDSMVDVKMDYIYSRNFVEFFEQAGFEQIDYLISALITYIEYEISRSKTQTVRGCVVEDKFLDVKSKVESNGLIADDPAVKSIMEKSERIFIGFPDMTIPVGCCHGDLTFSNILFNGNNYYLIDFLDSFIESPLLDIVKLRQDTAWLWSKLMYIHPCDSIRLRIVFGKIDAAIDRHFSETYRWYTDYYRPLQVMNFLRVLQYAHEPKVIDYLKKTLNAQLEEF